MTKSRFVDHFVERKAPRVNASCQRSFLHLAWMSNETDLYGEDFYPLQLKSNPRRFSNASCASGLKKARRNPRPSVGPGWDGRSEQRAICYSLSAGLSGRGNITVCWGSLHADRAACCCPSSCAVGICEIEWQRLLQ